MNWIVNIKHLFAALSRSALTIIELTSFLYIVKARTIRERFHSHVGCKGCCVPLKLFRMRERKHYNKAPIIQALIDVQVKSSHLVDLATLVSPPREITTDYPIVQPVFTGSATFAMNPGTVPAFDARQVGYSRTGPGEHKYAVQARLDGLTVSRFAPYETWENLRDEFFRIWNWYREVVEPAEIVRLAVRYSNRLDLPLPVDDFKHYLRTTPEIGGSLPGSLSGFVMQLQIPSPHRSRMIILNEAMVPAAEAGIASILLDINVYQTQHIDHHFKQQLEQLHDEENDFFEGSITDKTRELIK